MTVLQSFPTRFATYSTSSDKCCTTKPSGLTGLHLRKARRIRRLHGVSMSRNSNSCQLGAFMAHLLSLRWCATPTPTSANRRAKLSSTISPTYFARVNPRAYSEPTEHCRSPIVNAYPHSDSSSIQKEPGRRPLSCRAYANIGDSTCAHGWASLEAVFYESSSLTTAP